MGNESRLDLSQAFIEECRLEYQQVQTELKEIDLLIQQTTAEVDRLAQRSTQAANRLQQVEAQFDTIPRQDIREAYQAMLEAQQRLFTMRGQLEKLQAQQRQLQQRARLLQRVLEACQMREVAPKATAPGEETPAVIRVIEAQERERQQLARQMHDGPAQALTNLVLQAEICERLFEVDPDQARAELANLKSAVVSTFQRIRTFIANLRPMMLDDLGLIPTLKRYVEDMTADGFQVKLVVTGRERRFASYKEVTAFRVIQDLLTNAREVSSATSAQVSVDLGEDRLKVSVEDDGSGFELSQLGSGPLAEKMGLSTLRERIEMLGGKFQIESSPGRGTRVTFEIPLP
ncbi:MAG: sensor histidine kinase [Anaerolineae bacterium]|nr:sensor histidine kinase [Anaerolineae bacterium]MCX8066470.1 sensor histidine kinase [Anaerolineae bacterium]